MNPPQKRIDRKFWVPEDDHSYTYISINPQTGEIKECRDPITLLQQASYDLAHGQPINFQVSKRDG